MTIPNRQYAVEMRELVDETAAAQSSYIPRILASEIIAKLRRNDPDLLAGWLDLQAEHFVWQMINDRDRSRRSYMRIHAGRGAFAEAAERFSGGDSEALDNFLSMRFTVEDGSRRELHTLRRDSLTFVADTYEKREKENRFNKTIFRAMAEHVGNRTVGDVYTNEDLRRMFGGVTSAA